MNLEIAQGFRAGAIGRITELHGTYYAGHAGFGPYFESRVAGELADFARRYDSACDGIWLVLADGRIEGSIVIDGNDVNRAGAHLRWFIISDAVRGKGVGNRLMAAALDFCRTRDFENIYLNTIAGLDAARHLYEKYGFHLVQEKCGNQWGVQAQEQRFECLLQTKARHPI